MEDKITCKYCGSMNVAKRGARKIRHGSRHIYSCKDCFKRFSIGLNKKQFDAWLIVSAVCLYNKGYSYEEACEFIARKHKVQVGKSSVERWAKEYCLGFLDIRDRIISKYGRDCIIERAFNHSGLVYNFMLHKGKLKEFGKFSGLKDFIFSLAKGVDEKFFNGERCSQSSEGISCKVDVSENARLNSVVGEMLKIVRSNKQRHALVENLMLHCDRDSVAVEVPVWYWNKKINGGVCGHIDVLQVKFGKVWILDYKPDAEEENFERVMSQLYNYALALSFRSGVSLKDIKCGWFDSSKIFSFSPCEVMVKENGERNGTIIPNKDKESNNNCRDIVRANTQSYKIKEEREDFKEIKIKFEDGSILYIEDPNWVFALKTKLSDENISFEEFKKIFIEKVIKHWENKTVPTKWPWDCSWEEDFKDDIWHKLYHELYDWEEKEVKKAFGYRVAGLTPKRWFLDEVNRENAKLIREGVAIKNNELIIRNDTEEAKIYNEISERYGKLVHDETQKEFEKRKSEAENKYKNQSELAKEVLYYSIRGRLMGVILSKATKGKSRSIVTSDNSISIVKHDSVLTKKFDSEDNEETKLRFIKKIKKKRKSKKGDNKKQEKKMNMKNVFGGWGSEK